MFTEAGSGCGSVVECGLPKPEMRVRFPSPAPTRQPQSQALAAERLCQPFLPGALASTEPIRTKSAHPPRTRNPIAVQNPEAGSAAHPKVAPDGGATLGRPENPEQNSTCPKCDKIMSEKCHCESQSPSQTLTDFISGKCTKMSPNGTDLA